MTERIPRKIAELHETDPATDAMADKLLADSELMNSSLPDFRLEQPSGSDSDVDPQSKVIKDILDSDFNADRIKGANLQSLTKVDIPVDDLGLVSYVNPREKNNSDAELRHSYTGRLNTADYASTINERPLNDKDELLYPPGPKTPLEREMARKASNKPIAKPGLLARIKNLFK